MSNVSMPPIDEIIAFEPGDIPHVLSQIARLGEMLKAEFDLIAGRMSWLVIADSFIFSAFATVTSSYQQSLRAATVRKRRGRGAVRSLAVAARKIAA
jgi:hypothetical protein